MKTVAVFGGYGTFGALVARGLVQSGLRVRIAGRDAARARSMADSLGPSHEWAAADVTQPLDCRRAVAGCAVAVSCAGPFSAQGEALLGACLEAGAHYVDIGDDRAHAARVRAWGTRFTEASLTSAWGCSSLPGLSGALAVRCRAAREDPPRRLRVTLFIGNDNPKGVAAVASMTGHLGRTIDAPQGPLPALGSAERVSLPMFGRRRVVLFDSPEYDVMPSRLGVSEVLVQVGFEMRAFAALLPSLARAAARGLPVAPVVRTMARLAARLPSSGTSGGVVSVELTWPDGARLSAAAVANEDGQRMAVVPCVAVASALTTGEPLRRGAVTAYDVLGVEPLLARVTAGGFEVTESGHS